METVLGSSVLLTPRVEGCRKALDCVVTAPGLYSYQRVNQIHRAVSGWRMPEAELVKVRAGELGLGVPVNRRRSARQKNTSFRE